MAAEEYEYEYDYDDEEEEEEDAYDSYDYEEPSPDEGEYDEGDWSDYSYDSFGGSSAEYDSRDLVMGLPGAPLPYVDGDEPTTSDEDDPFSVGVTYSLGDAGYFDPARPDPFDEYLARQDAQIGIGAGDLDYQRQGQPAAPAATGELGVTDFEVDHSSRTGFMESFAPAAVQALTAKGLPVTLAPILVAIPVNEQGWQKEPPGGSHAYYGIKGSNPRTGANTGPVGTWEEIGGARVNITDTFRAYDSPAESVGDFLQFLEDNPRYAPALEIARTTGDPAAFIRAVHRAGYATDSAWADKIIRIASEVPAEAIERAAVPSAGARAAANARIPPGHYDGDGHDHGVASPYTQEQVDKAGNRWLIAFDYDQPYADPFNPNVPNHRGVDLQLAGKPNGGINTPYTAFTDGVVAHLTTDENGGSGIIVQDATGLYHRYFHNNTIAVKQGDQVIAGQTVLGTVGETGTKGFPHLHYEVSRNVNGDPVGQTMDPRPYISLNPQRQEPTAGAPQAQVAAPKVVTLETPYTSGPRARTDGIVVHSTRGGGVDAQAEFDATLGWFRSNPSQVSANAVIGPDGTIALLQDWNVAAHHAGQHNRTMYGIELAQSAAAAERNEPFTDAQYTSLSWLMGQVGQRFGVPIDRAHVVGHEETEQGRSVGKTDPGPNFDWTRALTQPTVAARPAARPAAQPTAAQPRAPAAPAPVRAMTAAQRRAQEMEDVWSETPPPPRTAQPAAAQPPGAPGVSYTVGGKPATEAEYNAAQARATESRQEFLAQLPEPTRNAYTEWETMRKARGEDPLNTAEFRAHLGRIGAPDPWADEERAQAAQKERYEKFLLTLPPTTRAVLPEWQAARRARGEDPNDNAALSAHLDALGVENPFKPRPAAAQGASTRTVPTIGGKAVSQAEYDAAVAENARVETHNAEVTRQNTAHNQTVAAFHAQADREQAALDAYNREYQRWRELAASADPELLANLGPQPSPPNTSTLQRRLSGDVPMPVDVSTGVEQGRRNTRLLTETTPASTQAMTTGLQQIQDVYGVSTTGADWRGGTPASLATAFEDEAMLRQNNAGQIAAQQIRQSLPDSTYNQAVRQLEFDRELQAQQGDAPRMLDAQRARREEIRLGELRRANEMQQGGQDVTPSRPIITRPRATIDEDVRRRMLDQGIPWEDATRYATIAPAEGETTMEPAPPIEVPPGPGRTLGRGVPGLGEVLPDERPDWVRAVHDVPVVGRVATVLNQMGEDAAALATDAIAHPATYLLPDPERPGRFIRQAKAAMGIEYDPGTVRGIEETRGPIQTIVDPSSSLVSTLTGQAGASFVHTAANVLSAGGDLSRELGLGDLADYFETGANNTLGVIYDNPALRTVGSKGVLSDEGFSARGLAEGLAGSAAPIAATVIGGILSGGTGALATAGTAIARAGFTSGVVSSIGGIRRDLRDEVASGAISRDLANLAAVGGGAIEYITEKIIPGADRNLLNGVGGKTARQFLQELQQRGFVGSLRQFTREFGQEAAEEAIVESYNVAAEYGLSSEKPTLEQAFQRIGSAGLIGGAAGAAMASPGAVQAHREAIRLGGAVAAAAEAETRAEVIAEGVHVSPASNDFSTFIVERPTADGLNTEDVLVRVDAAGRIEQIPVREMPNPIYPRIETPEDREVFARNHGIIWQDLTRRGIVSPEAAAQAHQDAINLTTMSGEAVRTSEAPSNPTSNRVATVNRGGVDVKEEILPETWHAPVIVPGAGLVVRASGNMDPRYAEETPNFELYQALGPHVSSAEALATQRGQEGGMLAAGIRKFGLMLNGGLGQMVAVSHGFSERRALTDQFGRPTPEASVAKTLDGISVDLNQLTLFAIEKYEKKNPDGDWRTDPIFTAFLAEQVLDTPTHEVGHGMEVGHDPRSFDPAAGAFLRMVSAQRRAVFPVVHDLWKRGKVAEVAEHQWRIIATSNPDAGMRANATERLRRYSPESYAALQSAGPAATYIPAPTRGVPAAGGGGRVAVPAAGGARVGGQRPGPPQLLPGRDGAVGAGYPADTRGVAAQVAGAPGARVGGVQLPRMPRGARGGVIPVEQRRAGPSAQVGEAPGEGPLWENPPAQEIESGATSRNQVPALMSAVPWRAGQVNFDLGGGRFERATQRLAGHGVENIVYDPYQRAPEHNTAALQRLRANGGGDTVTVANVLNVIQEPEARLHVIQQAENALKAGGTAYFSFYPGDKSGVGAVTKDGWQENRVAATYLAEIQQVFPGARVQRGVIVAPKPTTAGPSAQVGEAVARQLPIVPRTAWPDNIREIIANSGFRGGSRPRLLADGGIEFPQAVRDQNAWDAGGVAPRTLVYYRVNPAYNPDAYTGASSENLVGIEEGRTGMRVTAPTVFLNPLIYEGAVWVDNHAEQISQANGRPGSGEETLDLIRMELGDDPNADVSIETIAELLQLGGEPSSAPLIHQAARGKVGKLQGGLTDLIITNILAHELRASGYDGVITWIDQHPWYKTPIPPRFTEGAHTTEATMPRQSGVTQIQPHYLRTLPDDLRAAWLPVRGGRDVKEQRTAQQAARGRLAAFQSPLGAVTSRYDYEDGWLWADDKATGYRYDPETDELINVGIENQPAERPGREDLIPDNYLRVGPDGRYTPGPSAQVGDIGPPAIVREDIRAPLVMFENPRAAQVQMAQLVVEEDRAVTLGPEYRPMRLPNGAVIHLDPGVNGPDERLLMSSPGVADLAAAIRFAHDDALTAATRAGLTTEQSRFVGLVFDDQHNGFLYDAPSPGGRNDVGINPSTLFDHWTRQGRSFDTPEGIREGASLLQYAIAHEVAHNWNRTEGAVHERSIAQLRQMMSPETTDRIEAALTGLRDDGDLALVMPNVAARGGIQADPARIPHSVGGTGQGIEQFDAAAARTRYDAQIRRADAASRRIEQDVLSGELTREEADDYLSAIDDSRYVAEGLLRRATPEPTPTPGPTPGPTAGRVADRPRTGTAVVDPDRGVVLVGGSRPPPYSNEEAVADGWTTLPEGGRITTGGELINRLVDTPFISQADLVKILGERPADLDEVVQFMLQQRAKVVEGRLLPSDVAKAYVMTAASQGQGAVRAEIITDKTGFRIPEHFLTQNRDGVWQVRPEDAIAAWIASPTGQTALADLNEGQFNDDAWREAAEIRRAFSDNRLMNLGIFGGRPNVRGALTMRDVPQLTADLNAAQGNPRAIERIVGRLAGIGPRKTGFIQHLLGFGQVPTVDSRALKTWITGLGEVHALDDQTARVAKAITQHLGGVGPGGSRASALAVALTIARITSGYNQLRRSGFMPDIPKSVYNAIMHSWLWSKVKGLDRMKAPIYDVQAAPVVRPGTRGGDWWASQERRDQEMRSWFVDPYEEEDARLEGRTTAPSEADLLAEDEEADFLAEVQQRPGPSAQVGGIPSDEEAAIFEAVERDMAEKLAYIQQYDVAPDLYDEVEMRALAEDRARSWLGRSRVAAQDAERVREVLAERLPDATVEIAGSLAAGTFYGKGPRAFDLDLHVDGLDLPPSNGQPTVPLPAPIRAAFTAMNRLTEHPVDIFVTHEGKLWAVNRGRLTRQPGLFGKERGRLATGLIQTGRPLDWETFEQGFRQSLRGPGAGPSAQVGEAPQRGYQVQDGQLVYSHGTPDGHPEEYLRVGPDGRYQHGPSAQVGQNLPATARLAAWTPPSPIPPEEIRLYRQAAFRNRNSQPLPDGVTVVTHITQVPRGKKAGGGFDPVPLEFFVASTGQEVLLPPSNRGGRGTSLVNKAYNQEIKARGGRLGMPSGHWLDRTGHAHTYDSPQEIVFMAQLDAEAQQGQIRNWYREGNNPRPTLGAIPYPSTNRDKGGIREYRPDFFREDNNGEWEVWEAKPAAAIFNAEEFGIYKGGFSGKMGWDVTKKAIGVIPYLAEEEVTYVLKLGRDAVLLMPDEPNLLGKGRAKRGFGLIPGVDWRDLAELDRKNVAPEYSSAGNTIADRINDTAKAAVTLSREMKAAGVDPDTRRERLTRLVRDQLLPTAALRSQWAQEHGETRPLDIEVQAEAAPHIPETATEGPMTLDEVAEFDPDAAELMREAEGRGASIQDIAYIGFEDPETGERRTRLTFRVSGDPQVAQRLAIQLAMAREEEAARTIDPETARRLGISTAPAQTGQGRATSWYYDNQGDTPVIELGFDVVDAATRANIEKARSAIASISGAPQLEIRYNSDDSRATLYLVGQDIDGVPVAPVDLAQSALDLEQALTSFGVTAQRGAAKQAVVRTWEAEGGLEHALEQREQILGLRPIPRPVRRTRAPAQPRRARGRGGAVGGQGEGAADAAGGAGGDVRVGGSPGPSAQVGGEPSRTGTAPAQWYPVAPERFIELRDRNKRAAYMSPITPDDLVGRTIYVQGDEDSGFVGFALDEAGDIQNVFNVAGTSGNRLPGAGVEAIMTALAEGGQTLDAYDPFLPKYYGQFGFIETGRLPFDPAYAPPRWDFERDDNPDVVFMAWGGFNGETPDGIRERLADRTESTWRPIEAAEYYDDWDEAAAARATILTDLRGTGGLERDGEIARAGLRGPLLAPDPGPGRAGGPPLAGPSAQVADSGPARAHITSEIERLEARRDEQQTRVGQTDDWGFDYAAREVKTLQSQIDRRQRVLAQMAERSQFDFPNVEPRIIVPAEAGEGVTTSSDWNSGDLVWAQTNGATVRGVPIDPDDPRIPDTLYHATTNLPAVQESGMLRAGGVGGLGGDARDNVVSMTISQEIAEQIAADFRLAAEMARIPAPRVQIPRTMSTGEVWYSSDWTSPEAGEAYQQQVIEFLQAQAESEGWEYAAEYISEGAEGRGILRDYFSRRRSATGAQDPIIVSDQETLAQLDPERIGVVEIPRDALRTGALLTDFDLGRNHLEEVRSYGDVPLQAGIPLAGPSAQVGSHPADAPPFFSQLRRTVEQKMPNRATAQQIYGLLGRQIATKEGKPITDPKTKVVRPGVQIGDVTWAGSVKPEEVAWTDLESWLDAQQGPIEKAAVLAHLDQNLIRVEEVVLGAPAPNALPEGWTLQYEDDLDEWEQPVWVARNAEGNAEIVDASRQQVQERARLRVAQDDPSRVPKYGGIRFNLPGGEQYRELLLTLPQREPPALVSVEERIAALAPQHTQALRAVREANAADVRDGGTRAEEARARLAEIGAQRDALFAERDGITSAQPGQYYSGHYGSVPNVLVHVRFDIRPDASGRPMLFIQEIQSDWHQTGREKGYRQQIEGKDYDQWRQETDRLFNQGHGRGAATLTPQERTEVRAAWQRAVANRDALTGDPDAVPSAPFEKTGAWSELAFKRVVRWAAEQGIDQVGWTTGEQQNKRYDLSNRVRTVTYNPETLLLRTYLRGNTGGGNVREFPGSSPEDIATAIGQERAERLLARPVNVDGNHVLSGVQDLTIEGAGMQGFYDKILPTVAAKLGKPFGVRPSRATIPTYTVAPGAETVYDLLRPDGTPAMTFATREAAESALVWAERGHSIAERQDASAAEEIHVMDVPQPMQQAAMQGQPMFQLGGQEERADPFYSRTERTIEERMERRATAADIYGLLGRQVVKKAVPDQIDRNTGKVTPGRKVGDIWWSGSLGAEVAWIGLDTWLDEQTGLIKKEDVLTWVRENTINVVDLKKDVNLADLPEQALPEGYRVEPVPTSVRKDTREAVQAYLDTSQGELLDLRAEQPQTVQERLEDAEWELNEWLNLGDGNPSTYMQWANYARPGTFPDELVQAVRQKSPVYMDPGGAGYNAYDPQGNNVSRWGEPYETLRDARDAAIEDFKRQETDEGRVTRWGTPDLNVAGGEEYQELLLTLQDPKSRSQPAFIHPVHWGMVPNVLAHVRYDTRFDDQGRKVLFIQELQSDWHQQGRKKGYASTSTAYVIRNQRSNNESQEYGTRVEAEAALAAMSAQWPNGAPHLSILAVERETRGLPDTPFKKNWPSLALKRMFRYAADEGYDVIAWTTGAQQAARYDLSAELEEIRWISKDGEVGTLEGYQGYPEEEGPIVEKQDVRYDELPALIGQRATDELFRYEPMQTRYGDRYAVRGGALKLEDTAMSAFYDRLLVNEANDLSKKLGGKQHPRSETIQVMLEPGGRELYTPVPGIVLTDEMKASTWRGQPMFQQGSDQEGRPGADDDPYESIDPVYLDALQDMAAYDEIDFGDLPPRTDEPAQLGEVLPAPLAPAPGDDEINMQRFPSWAQWLVEQGDLAARQTAVNTQAPLVEGVPDVMETPAEIPGVSESQIRDVHAQIMAGPNAKTLTSAEIDALRNAILLQFRKVQRTAEGIQGKMTPFAAARVLDESRRYSALMAMASTPMNQWGALEEVWKSAPVSLGEEGEVTPATIEDFFKQQRALKTRGTKEAVSYARDEAVKRAEKLLSGSTVGRMKGPDRKKRNETVSKAGQAIKDAALTPGVKPSGLAHGIANAEDLSIRPLEVLIALRYNAMLLGPRGILTDYGTNTAMAFYKAFADQLLPEQGGLNPIARVSIAKVEMAAMARSLPLAAKRSMDMVLHGVEDAEAALSGTPRSITGKLNRRIENAQAEAEVQAGLGRPDIAAEERRRVVRLAGGKVGAIGLLEMAGRLKSVADVAIRTVMFDMEQARQAGVQAWREGDHRPGTKAWHDRVMEIKAGLDPDKKLPEGFYEEMSARSTREAKRVVFQGDMGFVGSKLEVIQQNKLGHFVLPFLRALYHIRGAAIDASPLGVAVTTGDVARGLAYRGLRKSEVGRNVLGATRNGLGLLGGPYQEAFKGSLVGPAVADLDRRMIANAIGTAAFMSILWYAFAGGLSGSGPPDDPILGLEDDRPDFEAVKLRNTMEATGWRRYSIRVPWVDGKTYWVQYSNWGPLAYLLGTAAALAEAHKYGMPSAYKEAKLGEGESFLRKTADLVQYGDAATARTAGRRAFGVIKDMSYMSGFMDLFKLTENVVGLTTGYGGPDTTKLSAAEGQSERLRWERQSRAEIGRYAGNLLTSFIPASALVNTIAQSQDPYERAMEFGDVRQQAAARIPGMGPIPSLAPPWDLPHFLLSQTPLGSPTGRRQGLAEKWDALGRNVENPYQGWWAISPIRAIRENLNDPVLNALIDAKVGVPTPPSEVVTSREKPGEPGKKELILVQITPHMKQFMADEAGERITEKVTERLKEWSPERRAAEPDAWHDLLAEDMKTIYKTVKDEHVKMNPSLIDDLSRIEGRIRPYVPQAKRAPSAEARDEDADGVPDISPPTTPPPVRTPTPRAPGAPVTPADRSRDQIPVTPPPVRTPTPAPRNGATPTPAPPRTTPTPVPVAPGGGSKTPAERARDQTRRP